MAEETKTTNTAIALDDGVKPGEVLVDIKGLKTHFSVGTKGVVFGIGADRKTVLAVDGVDLEIRKGETHGLVGESGCGKSTLGYTLLQLADRTDGSVTYAGNDFTKTPKDELRTYRRNLQIIFQDPAAALDPRMTIGQAISEALEIHSIVPEDEFDDRVTELLRTVGLNPYFRNRYPHEFSGGQQQRIVIARALAVQPNFIVCDEPISALDVSIQAQILNLLENLQEELGLTYLFISHDLRVVRHISDTVSVMYLGKIVEQSTSDGLYDDPLHPYTKALLSSVPAENPKVAKSKNRIVLEGDVASPIDPPSGCRFRTRCPIAEDACADSSPELREINKGHFVACHLA